MPLKIYLRGKIWHYRGSIAGRRLRGSTGATDKATAQRIASEREAGEWRAHLDGPESHLTFAKAALLYREADKPTRFLDSVEDYWKDTPVSKITSGSVRKCALALYPTGSGATRNRQAIVPTQAIINHAAESGLCSFLQVRRFPVVTKEKLPATVDWIESFARHASPHLGALAWLMFLTGARITEALDLTWGDIDLAAGRALIKQTKIGNERRAHLPPVLVAALGRIPSNRHPSEKVFRYASRSTAKPSWNAAIRRAGIKHLSFHACRHGFATALLHQGIDPITVAKLGGWKSAQHVLTTYGHARLEDTLADLIIDTQTTQRAVSSG